jgi:hypothetical protein
MFNNDSLLHWCVGTLFGWAGFGVLFGIPIHVVLGIPFSSVALFALIQCALHLVVNPWLFAARATTNNPGGRPLRRATVVIVWFTLAGIATFLQILHGDFTNRGVVAVFLGTAIFFGLLSLLALRQFQKRRSAR